MEKNLEALAQAQNCYYALEKFRQERERNKRYNYGDQWGDTIEVNGRRMTEEQFIKEEGSVPLKNNMIRRLVRNVIGVYNTQKNEPLCVARDPSERPIAQLMTTLLKCNGEQNRLSALYSRTLEEFLISGLAIHRKWYGRRNGRLDCWTDSVQACNFFIDCNMRDFRAWDCECIGELHDVPFAELCHRLARTDAHVKALRNIYGLLADPAQAWQHLQDFGYGNGLRGGFLTGVRPGMCRVIELWRREIVVEHHCHDTLAGQAYIVADADYQRDVLNVNAQRMQQGCKELIRSQRRSHEHWRYYFLSPMGDVLAQGDSPYAHGAHPYVVKAYPMIDGEIHSFVADVIDQQRYTNRLITMYDWMVRAAAKGVLLVPDDCLPRGCDLNDFADTWSRLNGVLVYHPSNHGEQPRQVTSNTSNAGISELINLQLKFFEDISGVHGALEGKLSNSAMSAELYNQQTQNATMALLDVLGAFREFVRDAAYKDASNMQQYYNADDLRAIAGEQAVRNLDFSNFRTTELDLSIVPGMSTRDVSAPQP